MEVRGGGTNGRKKLKFTSEKQEKFQTFFKQGTLRHKNIVTHKFVTPTV